MLTPGAEQDAAVAGLGDREVAVDVRWRAVRVRDAFAGADDQTAVGPCLAFVVADGGEETDSGEFAVGAAEAQARVNAAFLAAMPHQPHGPFGIEQRDGLNLLVRHHMRRTSAILQLDDRHPIGLKT